MAPEDLSRNYYCPLCGSNHYQLVGVRSNKTGQYVLVKGLFQCAGCSVVFTDPDAWTTLLRDSIIDTARYREQQPTREYPPDAVTIRKGPWRPNGEE
jgi:hypothetical protein